MKLRASSAARVMRARFTGRCSFCKGFIAVGDLIDHDKATHSTRHFGCRHNTGPDRKDPVPVEARIFDDAYDEQCRNACGL